MGLFPALLHREKVFCQFSASHADLYLLLLKEPFRLFWAKLRCFQHYVSEKRLFLGFLRKLCFWPFILSKTCFGVLAMKSDVSSILLQKNSDFVFVSEYPFSSLIVAKIRFCRLAAKSRCFEFCVTKKSVFPFLDALYYRKMFWLVGNLIRLPWALRAFLPFCV